MTAPQRPLHEAIADELRLLISTGEWEPGAIVDRAALAKEYGVRIPVITAALRILTDDRLLAHRGGVGLVVREQAPAHPGQLRRLLADADALLRAYETGRRPRVGELERWRQRARDAGVDV